MLFRAVFKIYDINDENQVFIENANLRVGKNINLNFSCNDVAWNPLDENILATGATNGAVVTWNVQKTSRSKMGMTVVAESAASIVPPGDQIS